MIKTLEELQKLMKLCRKQGVKEIKLGDVSISFGDMPRKVSGEATDGGEEAETDAPTPDELIFFSSGGAP